MKSYCVVIVGLYGIGEMREKLEYFNYKIDSAYHLQHALSSTLK